MSTIATFARASALSRLSLRLALFAAASVTTVAAHAVVVRSTTVIPIPQTIDGIYVNLVTGVTGTSPAAVPGWDIDPYSTGTGLGFFFSAATQNGGVADAGLTGYLDLPIGAVIGASSTFSQNAQTGFATAFQTAGTHTLGVKFLNEGTGVLNYGYVTITVTGAAGFPSAITGWAYENSGGSITVSAAVVPEPATYLMMLGGGLALLGAARRRQQQA